MARHAVRGKRDVAADLAGRERRPVRFLGCMLDRVES
jgi:hypothetical protein